MTSTSNTTGISKVTIVSMKTYLDLRRDLLLLMLMALSTLANGKEMSGMAMAFKNGQMDLDMRVTGEMTKLMDLALSIKKMEIFTREIGRTTWYTDMESTKISMGLIMKAVGNMMFNTVTVRKFGQITPNMKATTTKDRSMAPVSINGLIDPLIQVIGFTTKYKAKANTNGLMVESMKVAGRITICMAMESIFGKTDADIKVNT
jgi:hypothetical protein